MTKGHSFRTYGPGIFTTKPFINEYWEQVYLVSGDLIVGNDENGEQGKQFLPTRMRASRPA